MRLLRNKELLEEYISIRIDKLFFVDNLSSIFWNRLISTAECYIFGGVILDIISGSKTHRDIDVTVIKLNNEVLDLIEEFNGVRNSFGGYKISIDDMIFDIWEMSQTWLVKKNNTLNFDLINFLPSTVFFNSQAVLFSMNTNELFYNKSFLNFLYKKKIEITNPDNPFPELCIIKSYEYYLKGFLLTPKLKDYLIKYYPLKKNLLDKIQLKHYNKIIYKIDSIDFFISNLYTYKKERKKEKISLKPQLELF